MSDCHLDTDSISAFSKSVVNVLSSLAFVTQTQVISECRVELDLSENPLQNRGLLEILTILRCENCPISSLDLSKTVNGKPFRYDKIETDIQHTNFILKELDLSDNYMSGNKVLLLAEYMQVCRSLQNLNCWDCSLSSCDTITILQHLRHCNISLEHLKEFDVSSCSIDDEGAYALFECLSDLFPCLENINLDGNLVNDVVYRKLKNALEVSKHTKVTLTAQCLIMSLRTYIHVQSCTCVQTTYIVNCSF